jgi:glyoxylate reductase
MVTNTPGVLTEATADLTLALLLAVARRVIEGDNMMRRGDFHGWHPLMLRGISLQGKQLGIIGMGRIGTAVAHRARAFGMDIVYASRSEVTNAVDARPVPLDELLETSDFVSIHAPLTGETRHLIDAAAMAKMKSTAFLINTARGPIVDEAALADALISGKIAGAGLDVYEDEPQFDERLASLSNVVLLPHLGSATMEARHEMARLAAMNALLVLRGSQPLHRVV